MQLLVLIWWGGNTNGGEATREESDGARNGHGEREESALKGCLSALVQAAQPSCRPHATSVSAELFEVRTASAGASRSLVGHLAIMMPIAALITCLTQSEHMRWADRNTLTTATPHSPHTHHLQQRCWNPNVGVTTEVHRVLSTQRYLLPDVKARLKPGLLFP